METEAPVPLGQYLRPLRQHARLIGVITVAVLLLGFLASTLVSTTYRSTASILVTPISADPTSTFESDVEVGMATEERIATSTAVVVQVADRLAEQSVVIDPETLAANVTVSSPKDSRILDVAYDASTADRAQLVADTFAQSYLDYRSQLANEDKEAVVDSLQDRIVLLKDQLAETSAELLRHRAGSESFITITVEKESIKSELDAQQEALSKLSTLSFEVGRIISPAERPDGPEGLGTTVVLFGALIGGLVLGCLAAFVVDAFKDGTTYPTERPSGPKAPARRGDQVARAELPGASASSQSMVDVERTGSGHESGAPVPAVTGELPVVPSTTEGPNAPKAKVPPIRRSDKPATTADDEELTALLRDDLWDDEPGTADPGWPSNIGTRERTERNGRSGSGPGADKGKVVVSATSSSSAETSPVIEPDFNGLLARLRPTGTGSFSCLCFGESSREASLAAGLGLAVALQDRGSRVLLIDLLLDAPALDELLRIPVEPGLLDVLAGSVTFDEAQRGLPAMGDLQALTVGAASLLSQTQRTDELINGWTMRTLLLDAESLFEATIFVGGSLADAERIDLVVRETDGIVVGTDKPVGDPIGPQLTETLSALPTETLGVVSLDAALAARPTRSTGVPRV